MTTVTSMANPVDIAPVVAFLAGPEAGWVSEQAFLVNSRRPL